MSLLQQLQDFCFKTMPIPENTYLLEEGQDCEDVYVLAKGSVRVTAGQVIIGDFHKPGDTFGEMAVILKQRASASVHTLTDCEFYVIKDLETFLTKNPKMGFEFLKMSYKRLKKMNLGVNIMYEHINL